MNRYCVTYTDLNDDGCPRFTWHCSAWDQEHAERKFYESDDDEGWVVVKIKRVPTTPAERSPKRLGRL